MGEQEALGQAGSGGPADLASDESLILLEQTNQLRVSCFFYYFCFVGIRDCQLIIQGIMTILRDRDTERGDFIFHADRLSTLIVEKALSLIPYQPKTVTTPLSLQFEGVEVKEKVSYTVKDVFEPQDLELTLQNLIGVSILRSGGPFVHGLRRVIRDVPVGAMLIQSDPKTGEPLLLRVDLPQSVKSAETSKDTRVLLLDSQMGTGAAASELFQLDSPRIEKLTVSDGDKGSARSWRPSKQYYLPHLPYIPQRSICRSSCLPLSPDSHSSYRRRIRGDASTTDVCRYG